MFCFAFLMFGSGESQVVTERGRRKQLAGVVVSPGTAEVSLPLMACLRADLQNCVFLLAISEKWSKEKK